MSRKYEIQAGDTLFAISKRFYGEPTYFDLIAAANCLTDGNKIAPGQTISIPDLPETRLSAHLRERLSGARSPDAAWELLIVGVADRGQARESRLWEATAELLGVER